MSRNIFHSSAIRQLMLYSFLLGSLFVILSTCWITYGNYQQHRQNIENNLGSITQQIAGISSSLKVQDRNRIEAQLDGLLNLPGVVFLVVSENLQQASTSIQRGNSTAQRDWVKTYPLEVVASNGIARESLGQLTAVISMEHVLQQLRKEVWNAFWASSIGITIVILVIFSLVHFKVIRHLLNVAEYLERLELVQLDNKLILNGKKLHSEGEGEVGQVVKAINELHTRITNTFEQHQKDYEQLKRSEINLKTLVETIPDLVWVKDKEGVFLMCNPRLEQLYGSKESEVIGKTDFDFVDEELAKSFRKHDQLAMVNGRPTINEEEVTFASDGHTEILETIKVPMVDDKNDLIGILGVARDISQRELAKNKLELQDELLNEMGRLANIGGWEFDPETGEGTWTEQVAKIHEIDATEQTSTDIGLSYYQGENREAIEKAIQEAIESGTPYDLELKMTLPNGVEKYVRTIGKALMQGEKIVKIRGSIQDITEQKLTEQALQRSQKMDAVGQLTGGIAHDFNNILGIILGNLDLLKLHVDNKSKVEEHVETIQKSALRAGSLTRQLLGFSRLQPAKVEITNINQLIKNLDSLIIHSVTPQIAVEEVLSEDLWLTNINQGDFEDALLNLVLNARDAMSGSGQLTLETHNTILDQSYCRKNPNANPGEYVQLTVSDNGPGISYEMQDRIFEPFFTTKEMGKGTGLGLSMIYGFAKRSGGSIKVYSEPGIGTTFRLYLPRVSAEKKVVDEIEKILPEKFEEGSETLLVVDDEIDLLDVAKESLSMMGYKVLTANDANEALEQLKQNPEINLMFSDVVMPNGLNGYELAEKAVKLYPQLKVLLTSGYTQKVVARNGQAIFETTLLSKPYTQLEMSQRIRKILDDN